jgi:hypothetical protein
VTRRPAHRPPGRLGQLLEPRHQRRAAAGHQRDEVGAGVVRGGLQPGYGESPLPRPVQPAADLGGVVVPRLLHQVAHPAAVVAVRVREAAHRPLQPLLQLVAAAEDLRTQLLRRQHVERVVDQAVVADLHPGAGHLGQLVPGQQRPEGR